MNLSPSLEDSPGERRARFIPRVGILSLFIALVHLPVSAATQVGSLPYGVSSTGAGNSHSPVFSADGKHVAFVSHANNLVTNDDLAPHLDLFVRDLVTSNTVLVSVNTNGLGGANDNIGLYSLSSNGQVVAFDTAASNLLPWDNNRVSDIYVQDLLLGGHSRVTWSAGDEGDGNANGPSYNPLVSEDGRYVIFESLASNLVTNDFNGTNDIFIHDLETGITELVSVNADGTASPDGPSHSPSISADGLTVAFVSHAANLVAGVTNRLGEVYARNIAAGTTRWAAASHVPATHQGFASTGAYQASEPILSAQGRFMLFKTLGATVRFDLQRGTNSQLLVFTNAAPDPPFRRLDYFQFHDNPRLAASSGDTSLAFTPDGRYACYSTRTNLMPSPGLLRVDFESLATNAIWTFGGQGCMCPDYYVTNVGATAQIVVTNFISQAGQSTWRQTTWLSLNSNATRIVFVADATNLVEGVINRSSQLYRLDAASGTVSLLSTNTTGSPGPDLGDVQPSITHDRSLIVWDSPDDKVVTDDLNRAWDVFMRNVDTGETQLISARHPDLPAASGTALSRLDLNPGAISANGQRLAFISLDNTLTPDDTNFVRDAFVLDLEPGSTLNASKLPASVWPFRPVNLAAWPALSADGRYLTFAGEFFAGQVGGTNRTIFWRDLQTSSNDVVVSGDSLSQPSISPDGRFLAFHSSDSLVPGFPDGNNAQDVFVYQMTSTGLPYTPNYDGCTLTTSYIGGRIASRTPSDIAVANGPSINPAFSPDSFWILFQSRATDLTEQALPPQSQYQLYGRGVWSTNVSLPGCVGLFPGRGYSPTKLISYSTAASPDPNGNSIDLPLAGGGANPRFSADSRYVVFESSPNLIYRHDLLNDWVITVTGPDGARLTNQARLTNTLACSNCGSPTLNADGRLVAYETRRATNVANDIFVKDLQTGEDQLISVNLAGNAGGNGSSSTPLLSHDARFVVFASKASDLVPGDNNRAMDIFVRDRLNHVTHCLSRNWNGTGTGNRVSSNPIMSADGRTVAFQSFASDLVPGDYNDTRDVFVVTLGGQDTDGDGMDDDWEMAYFNTLARDGSGDFDNDGASDLAEFRAGTNPANDASILRVLRLTTAADPVVPGRRSTVLLWTATPGRTYRVQFKSELNFQWQAVDGDVTASSTSASLTDTVEAAPDDLTRPHRFYRVLLVR